MEETMDRVRGAMSAARAPVPSPAAFPATAPGQAAPVWSRGDYAVIARLLVGLGQDLVSAAGVGPGQRVLDVAAGSGNAALAAAALGADVVAADLTPELLERGRAESGRRGLDLEWVEANAESLPFPSAEFDVVLSSIGAMFAPDHIATARELMRVCRPGGTVAMANWTARGAMGRLFALLDRYVPTRAPGTLAPTTWGDPAHVRHLFGDRPVSLRTEYRTARLDYTAPPAQWCALYRTYFAPVVETYARLAGQPERRAALDRDLLRFADREYHGPVGGPGSYEFEYLLVRAELPAA